MSNANLENRILTNEELVSLIKAGECVPDNMLTLWRQNKRFISSLASKYAGGAEREDLEQSGYIGLSDAVQHYDSGRGVPFISYAAFWIKRRMKECVDNNRAIHLPSGIQDDMREYKKIVREYEQKYACEPSEREITALMRIGREKLAQIQKALRTGQIRSLSEPVENEDGETPLVDILAAGDNMEEDTVQSIDAEDMKRSLWCAVDALPADQSCMIRLRFIEGLTVKEIEKRMGVTSSQVNTIQRRAERTLRSYSVRYRYRRYYEQYLSAAPISHVGVRRFRQTWTSEVEKAALEI